jgi:predicted DNA-binding transcriptional regulator AlpA
MSTSEILRRDRQRKNAKRAERNERRERRPKRIIRPREAMARLGIGKTNFWENFARRRLRLVRLGPRALGVIEEELDALIDELAAERDLEIA